MKSECTAHPGRRCPGPLPRKCVAGVSSQPCWRGIWSIGGVSASPSAETPCLMWFYSGLLSTWMRWRTLSNWGPLTAHPWTVFWFLLCFSVGWFVGLLNPLWYECESFPNLSFVFLLCTRTLCHVKNISLLLFFYMSTFINMFWLLILKHRAHSPFLVYGFEQSPL